MNSFGCWGPEPDPYPDPATQVRVRRGNKVQTLWVKPSLAVLGKPLLITQRDGTKSDGWIVEHIGLTREGHPSGAESLRHFSRQQRKGTI